MEGNLDLQAVGFECVIGSVSDVKGEVETKKGRTRLEQQTRLFGHAMRGNKVHTK